MGELFFLRTDNQLSAVTVTGRTPIVVPPEEAAATAAQIFQGAEVQQQIATLIGRLRSRAKIVYSNGFVPAQKVDPSSTPKTLAPDRGATH